MRSVQVGYHSHMDRLIHNLARPCLLGLLLSLVVGVQFGCQRRLFPKDSPRTQFETYDRMRQKFVPLEETDVFGEPKPALRARLGS